MNNGAVIRQNRGDSTIGARIDLGDDTLNEHVLRGMENVEDRLRVELEKKSRLSSGEGDAPDQGWW